MKNKLLVRIKLPATGDSHEFLLPHDLTVSQCAALVSRMLSAREPGRYEASSDAELMYLEGASSGTIINPRETVRSLMLQGFLVEGSRLMLV